MSIDAPTFHDRVEASTPSRVHFGLTGCGNVGQRIFGGSGAAIDGFRTIVRAERTDGEDGVVYEPSGQLLDPSLYMSDRAFEGVGTVANSVKEAADQQGKLGDEAIQLTIVQSAPEHMGLGSKTSLEMAVAYALGNLLLADKGRIVSHDVIREFTTRGGTSRIGVLACAKGGVIFEDGHPVPDGEQRVFLPSSRRAPIDSPSELARAELESNFRIGLFYDPSTPRIEGQREVDIFRQLMPFPDEEVYKAIAAERDVLSAFQRRDMRALSLGFRHLNSVGLKREEVALQSDTARSWLSDCWDQRLPVGLSSFGPIVFCMGRNGSDELATAQSLASDTGLRNLGEHPFDNHGTQIEARYRLDDVLAEMIAAYDRGLEAERAFRYRKV